MARIERATSPLPRECSTTEPHGPTQTSLTDPPNKAEKYNLTRRKPTKTLERETGIEPASLAWKARVLPLNYSRSEPFAPRPKGLKNRIIRNGGGGWIRTSVLVRGQIYSLLPLTTRPPLLGEPESLSRQTLIGDPLLRINHASVIAQAKTEAWCRRCARNLLAWPK